MAIPYLLSFTIFLLPITSQRGPHPVKQLKQKEKEEAVSWFWPRTLVGQNELERKASRTS